MAKRNDRYIKTIANAFKERRNALGLGQQHIADKSEMTIMSYNRIENGKVDIRLSTLHELMKALKFPDLEKILKSV